MDTGNFVFSDNLYSLFGLDPEKVTNNIEAFFEYFHPEDLEVVQEKIQQLTLDHQPFEVEYRVYPPDKPMRIIKAHAYPTWDANQQLTGFSGNLTEVTEKKKMQQELDRKIYELNRSNKELESFAYVASHDLQEPLRKITSFGSRLQEREFHKLSENGQLFLTRMIAATQRMDKLLNDLLSFSRLSYRKEEAFKKVDLNKTLEEVLGDIDLKARSMQAEIIINNTLPTIEAIPSQMQQLFQNLIANALKFSHPDRFATVEISVAPYEPQQKISLLDYQDSFHWIQVKDNGIGFDQKYGERIFAIFQRLHGRSEFEGSGIGLAICKKIVENHQGTISAEGQEGQGATFNIILPQKQPYIFH